MENDVIVQAITAHGVLRDEGGTCFGTKFGTGIDRRTTRGPTVEKATPTPFPGAIRRTSLAPASLAFPAAPTIRVSRWPFSQMDRALTTAMGRTCAPIRLLGRATTLPSQ